MTELAPPEVSPVVDETVTYRHRVLLLVDLTYSLYSDRVLVTGSRIGVPKLEAVIWLRTLSLNTSTEWVRSLHSHWSLVVIICIVGVTLLMLPGAVGVESASFLMLGFFLCLLLPALAYAHRSRKLVRYTHFLSNEGVNTLSVGDAGPDFERYERFVQELLQRVKASHGVS